MKTQKSTEEGLVTAKAWKTHLARTVAQLRNPPGEPEPQDRLEFALGHLWRILQSPPPAVVDAYEALDEDKVVAQTANRAAQLSLRDCPDWAPALDAHLPDLVLALAVEIRALDEALRDNRGTPRASGDPNRDYLAYGLDDLFIIPRAHPLTHVRKVGQRFDRRGLIHNRVIPTLVEGYAVRLREPVLRGPGMQGEPSDLLSAVFPGVDLSIVQQTPRFWVDGLKNENGLAGHIKDQFAQIARGRPAMVVVWPELAVSPKLLDSVVNGLDQAVWSATPVDVGFVVAGSWHDLRGKNRVNVSPILDANGTRLFEVLKRTRFQYEKDLEDITPGDELQVLIYGDVLIAFGICKDLCERRQLPNPFSRLDVDFVFVPSLGESSTMEAHAATAHDLQIGFGARAFVVQQSLATSQQPAPWGVILKPGERPRSGSVAEDQKNLLARTTVSCTTP